MRFIMTLIMRARADGCTSLASMLAYNFFLAVVGVLILTVSTMAYLPIANLGELIVQQLQGVLPTDALSLIDRTLTRTLDHGRLPIFIISLLGTVYIMSNGYAGLINSLNRIYRIRETRPWLLVRLRALVLSFLAAVFILGSFSLVIVAPAIARALSDDQGYAVTISVWMGRMRWPAIILLVVGGVETIYRYGPCGGPRWRILTPGTGIAAAGWLVSTLGFGYYVNQFGTYDNVYGSLGAVVALLTWMWISALLILVGGEVNALIMGEGPRGLRAPERVVAEAPDV